MTSNVPEAKSAAVADLAERINEAHAKAKEHADCAVECARQAGELLLQAKAGVKHGDWQGWLRENVTVTPRMAQQYMRLARELPKLSDEKRNAVSHLPIRYAIAQLSRATPALIEMDADGVQKVVEIGESGERLTRAVRNVEMERKREERRKRASEYRANTGIWFSAPRTKLGYLASGAIPPGVGDFAEWRKLKAKTEKLPEFAELRAKVREAKAREREAQEALRAASSVLFDAERELDRAVHRHLIDELIPDDYYDDRYDDDPNFFPLDVELEAELEAFDAEMEAKGQEWVDRYIAEHPGATADDVLEAATRDLQELLGGFDSTQCDDDPRPAA